MAELKKGSSIGGVLIEIWTSVKAAMDAFKASIANSFSTNSLEVGGGTMITSIEYKTENTQGWSTHLCAAAGHNTITKTSKARHSWEANFRSENGLIGDMYCEWQVFYTHPNDRDGGGAEMVGLGTTYDTNTSFYQRIPYEIYTHCDRDVRIYQGNTHPSTPAKWDPNIPSVFRIEMVDGNVTYYKDGVLIYTSTVKASKTATYHMVGCMHSHGRRNRIYNIKFGKL